MSSYSADSNLHSKMPTPISARPVGNYTINDQDDTALMEGRNKNNNIVQNKTIESARRSLDPVESQFETNSSNLSGEFSVGSEHSENKRLSVRKRKNIVKGHITSQL